MRDKSHDEIMGNRYRERPIEAVAMFHRSTVRWWATGGVAYFFSSCPASTPQMLNVCKFSSSCRMPI